MRDIISTPDAPLPVGPYSQAIRSGSLIFTAGQIALDPKTNKVIAGDAAAQTTQVMKNLSAVLESAGSSLSKVVKTTIFLKNMDDFAAVNTVYGGYFGDSPPARSTVEVSRLPKDVLVEIECIALV